MAATALEEKLTAVGFKKLARPSKRWYHARAAKLTTMSWSHPQLGDFIVGIEGKSVGDVTEKEGMTFAPVHVGTKMPGQFRVTFAANLNDSVICVLQARGNNVEESFGNLPELTVKVEWDGDKPQTRRKNEDNLDHFLCTNEGVVMQLQTSFVTRHDSFYLANHELWCLQVVETTEQNPNYKTHEVNGKHYAAVNLWDSQAYPGADWLITNAQTGPKVIEAVIASGAEIAVVTELPVLDWDPPAFPQAEEGSLLNNYQQLPAQSKRKTT